MTTTRALIGLVAATALPYGCARDSINAPQIDPTVVASVSVIPAPPPSLYIGASLALTAVVRNASDSALSTRVAWSSSNVAVATVPASDTSTQFTVVTAVSPGSATITATSQTKSASVTIVVRPPGPVATVEVTPATQSPMPGESYQLAVVLRDSNSVLLTGRQIAFASSAPAIATISTTGLVTAVAPGSATLTVTSEGKSGSATVAVQQPPPPPPPPVPSRAFLWTAADGMKDLGLLPGFTAAGASAINGTGEVAGTLFGNSTHAFTWTATGGMRDLGTLPGGTQSAATGINGSGQVVGWADVAVILQHAVLWTAGGTIQDLGTLPGDYVSQASAINDGGEVVGWSGTPGYTSRPFIWTAAGGMQPFPVLSSKGGSVAVNGLGQVAGNTDPQAFRWSQQLGLQLLPFFPNDNTAWASGINDGGDVVGASFQGCFYTCGPSSLPYHAVLWPAAGGVINLTAEAGFKGDEAPAAINSAGQIVGGHQLGGHAFLWSTAGGLKDLGVLPGRTNSAATAINAVGQVVGSSYSP